MSEPYRISSRKSVYVFSQENRPVLEVESGAEVAFEVRDAFSGQITSPDDLPRGLDYSRVNAATGPLAIKGARPGQSLVVDLLDIELEPVGYQCVVPGSGVLAERFSEPMTLECVVDGDHVVVGGRRHRVSPCVGTIGVAPAGDDVPTITPGDHGGNLDAREIGPGARLYLPVFVPGGLLAMGDVHAVQGDGEVSGVAAEFGGTVRVRVTLLDAALPRPLLETPDHLLTLASHEDLGVAATTAVNDMVDLLGRHGWEPAAAYSYLSLAGNLSVAQMVNPRSTVKIAVPKPDGWALG